MDALPRASLLRQVVARAVDDYALLLRAGAAEGASPGDTVADNVEAYLRSLGARDGDEPEDPQTFALCSDLIERPELLQPPERVVARLGYRGRATALCGMDKSGKSTLLGHAIAALTRGDDWLGEPVRARHHRAVLLGLEEAIGDPVRRFVELGAVPDRIQILTTASPDLLERTRELLTVWPADLVVIDSLTEYARVTTGVPDSGDAAGWAAVVRPLVRLARDTDVALLILHHMNKSGTYRDSSEIAAAVDCILEMSMPENGDDPCTRRIRGRGRWTVEPFTVALRDGRYELDGGGTLSPDARALLHVEANPGISLSALRRAIGGRAQKVDAIVGQLEARGAIRKRDGGGFFATASEPPLEGL